MIWGAMSKGFRGGKKNPAQLSALRIMEMNGAFSTVRVAAGQRFKADNQNEDEIASCHRAPCSGMCEVGRSMKQQRIEKMI
jgi:hypothetical protein